MELRPDAETPLEQALARAASDAAEHPAFYNLLLESTVYVVSGAAPDPDAPAQTHDLKAGDRLAIATSERPTGETVVPFFASIEALRRVLTGPAQFLALPARSLLEMTRGAWLVLNPGAPVAREFSPDEAAALLETGTAHAPQPHVLSEDTKVLIGQPAERPEALVAALTRFFGQRAAVQTGYLAVMQDPARGETPVLLVGVETDEGDTERLMREIATVASEAAPAGRPVDLVRVAGEHFLASVEPFYVR